MNEYENDLIARGLARYYRGRLIPIMKGGDGTEDEPADEPVGEPLFPDIPADFTALSVDELNAFVSGTLEACREASSSPTEFVTGEYTSDDLAADMRASVDAIRSARAELASRIPAEPVDLAAIFAEAEEAAGEDEEPADEDEPAEEAEPEGEAAIEPVVASAATRTRPQRLPVQAPARRRTPEPAATRPVALTAAAPNLGLDVGEQIPDPLALAEMMTTRRWQFGDIGSGVRGEKIPIARVDWRDRYPDSRQFQGGDFMHNMELISRVTDPELILQNFIARRDGDGLQASGGLCAPVTPYYDLQMVSVALRPVRAALAAFNADRGGIRFARPATLASITTAIGVKTAEQDAAGGTEATKTCQVVDCPPFDEVDVQILFHCLQFGNLGARTFPERVAQWNNLVLAAHARLAESELLTGIDTASTQVSASSLGLGASATLPSQILAAAEGMRSRNRMDPNTVLRVILPQWVLSLLVSDVYRSQFDRFAMGPADFIRILRAANVEPTFHIDGANGRGQVFDEQDDDTGLLPFPESIVWYLYPEGSFLFVDGGTLELGLVRDSVLNRTNDFQIFGESFENVAFVGVESLAVETPVCDTGYTSGAISGSFDATDLQIACPYDYSVS